MRVIWFLSSKPLQLFMIKEGLNPKVVVHSQGFELLGQGKVGEDHVMNLGRNKSVFNQNETRFVTTTCCPNG